MFTFKSHTIKAKIIGIQLYINVNTALKTHRMLMSFCLHKLTKIKF